MKKRILLPICFFLCILGITACGTDPKDVDYNGYTYEQLEEGNKNLWMTLESMDESTKAQYLAGGDEATASLIEEWDAIRSQLGEYKEVKNFNIVKSGKTLATETTIDYEMRAIILTCVYTYRTMELKDITVDILYSTGEKMQKAALNTVMGMGTVFVMLIIISFLISGFSIISKIENKYKQKHLPHTEHPVQEMPDPVQEVLQAGEAADNLELAAVITAAISAASAEASTGQPTDFVVRSIKRR